jgi:hypothetical protein
MEEDRELLRVRKSNMSRNAKNAILWRRAEKRILHRTLAIVEERAKRLHSQWMVRDADPLQMKGDHVFETVSDEL